MGNPVILVTGASRGLGAAIARLLLTTTPPLTVVTVARSPAPAGTIALPDGTVHTHTHLRIDLSTPSGPSEAVKETIDTYGRLDGLILNHAVLDPVERIADTSGNIGTDGLDAWRKTFDVNFFSIVALLRSSIPHLRTTSGRVIFVSSGASHAAYPAWGAYSATKAALNSICRTLALEEPSITAVSIRPGVVDTEMQREIREKHAEAMGAESHKKFTIMHENKHLLRPEQPGAVIANLAMRATKELSGGYYSWDGEEMKNYQGTVVSAPE